MGLVVANVRRSAPGTPSRTTVRVSTNPSRRLEAASGLIRSSQGGRTALVAVPGVGPVGLTLMAWPAQSGHLVLQEARDDQHA